MAGRAAGDVQQDVLRALWVGGVAESEEVDALATDDVHLLGDWKDLQGANVMGLDEALDLIGLYQRRAYGEVRWNPSPSGSVSITSYHCWRAAAEEWVPAYDEWFGRCRAIAVTKGDQQLPDLARGVASRLTSALRAVDEVRGLHQVGQGDLGGGDWPGTADSVMMFTWSAFDVLARAADRIFDLQSPRAVLGWQKDSWRKRLHQAPNGQRLAELSAPGTPHHGLVKVLSRLRNGIHQAPYGRGGYSESFIEPPESVLMLTDGEIEPIRDMLGEHPAWFRSKVEGVESMPHEPWLVAAVPLVEWLVVTSFHVLNDLIEVMSDGLPDPPPDHIRAHSLINKGDNRDRIRALVGPLPST
ncbi:MAG: hypothetical protein M3O70_21020 [Actinomycetota bacterium]|nr:hypothetical protein [Actinomycetota bacterium]